MTEKPDINVIILEGGIVVENAFNEAFPEIKGNKLTHAVNALRSYGWRETDEMIDPITKSGWVAFSKNPIPH